MRRGTIVLRNERINQVHFLGNTIKAKRPPTDFTSYSCFRQTRLLSCSWTSHIIPNPFFAVCSSSRECNSFVLLRTLELCFFTSSLVCKTHSSKRMTFSKCAEPFLNKPKIWYAWFNQWRWFSERISLKRRSLYKNTFTFCIEFYVSEKKIPNSIKTALREFEDFSIQKRLVLILPAWTTGTQSDLSLWSIILRFAMSRRLSHKPFSVTAVVPFVLVYTFSQRLQISAQ